VTPWGTWVSCEEALGRGPQFGYCYQVDPANKAQSGITTSQKTDLVRDPGGWEAFAWDDDDKPPRGYVTEDANPGDDPDGYGALVRYTPDSTALACYNGNSKEQRWCTLNSGSRDYLKLNPYMGESNCGTISWVADREDSSASMYLNSEGIDITDGILRFTAKTDRLWFEIDLRKQTYCQWSTLEGFPQSPDNIRFLGDVLYFCTDGRTPNGVFGRDSTGYFGILQEIDYNTEVAGLDFSPDGKYMYLSFQTKATWQFWREDGYAFTDKPASTTYVRNDGHEYDAENSLALGILALLAQLQGPNANLGI
jgi:hypothetical protein